MLYLEGHRDRMVVLCNQYLSTHNEFEYPTHGEVYSIQNYVIKFVNDLRQVNKTDRHDKTKILLTVALNTTTLKNYVVQSVLDYAK